MAAPPVIAFAGDPTQPANAGGTFDAPSAELQIPQLGHAIVPVRGLGHARACLKLPHKPTTSIWLETFCLDRHDTGNVHREEWKLENLAAVKKEDPETKQP